MGETVRRSRFEIWLDILAALQAEQDRKDQVRPSRVQSSANLPYGRFWDCMQEMREQGLVQVLPLTVTAKGDELLRHSRELRAALRGAETDATPE